MASVGGVKRLVDQLRARAAKVASDSASVAVGYTASYALPVHENRQMKWRGLPRDRSVRLHGSGKFVTTGHEPAKKAPGLFWGPAGRAGYLLDVAREMQRELAETVRDMLQRGKTLAQALLVAGLKLQAESQKNVPVETGNLRASAFTRLESTSNAEGGR